MSHGGTPLIRFGGAPSIIDQRGLKVEFTSLGILSSRYLVYPKQTPLNLHCLGTPEHSHMTFHNWAHYLARARAHYPRKQWLKTWLIIYNKLKYRKRTYIIILQWKTGFTHTSNFSNKFCYKIISKLYQKLQLIHLFFIAIYSFT